MKGEIKNLFGMLCASSVRRDFLFLLTDRAVRLAVGLVLSGLVARHVGAEAFGWLSYAGALTAFGAAIANLGLDSIVVREAVNDKEKANDIVGAAFVLRISVGLALTVLLWMLIPITGGGNATQRTLVGILALGTMAPAFSVPTLWFQARTESRIAVCAALVGFLACVIARIWLLIRDATVIAFAWAGIAEMVLSGILIAGAMRRSGGRFRFDKISRHGTALLRDAWPLLIGAFAATLYMRIDQIMLRWLVGADAVGIYSAATKISEAAYGIPLLAGTSVMATLTLASGDTLKFRALVDRYLQASAALGYALVIPCIIFTPWLLRTLYGESFSGSGTIAQIHLISVVFVCVSVARGRVLVITGMTRFAMATALVGGVVNIMLNLVMIPFWGGIGAAIATVLAHAMAAIGSTLAYPPTRDLGLQQLRALLRPRVRAVG